MIEGRPSDTAIQVAAAREAHRRFDEGPPLLDDVHATSFLDEEGLAAVADVPVQRLSAGQQRRVCLTRTRFLTSRKLWILDEPFSSLDDDAVKRLSSRLAQQAVNGGVVVFTTHQDVKIDAPTNLLELA